MEHAEEPYRDTPAWKRGNQKGIDASAGDGQLLDPNDDALTTPGGLFTPDTARIARQLPRSDFSSVTSRENGPNVGDSVSLELDPHTGSPTLGGNAQVVTDGKFKAGSECTCRFLLWVRHRGSGDVDCHCIYHPQYGCPDHNGEVRERQVNHIDTHWFDTQWIGYFNDERTVRSASRQALRKDYPYIIVRLKQNLWHINAGGNLTPRKRNGQYLMVEGDKGVQLPITDSVLARPEIIRRVQPVREYKIPKKDTRIPVETEWKRIGTTGVKVPQDRMVDLLRGHNMAECKRILDYNRHMREV